MPISIVQLGSPRSPQEGPRIGTVRRPPRGVPKSQFARRNFYDVWFPNLSPSAKLLKSAGDLADNKQFAAFAKKFRSEMTQPAPSRDLDLLAALSHTTNFSIGCYCEDESHCHRSVLRQLLKKRGAKFSA
jgi:uncharacterized protein YeaO (DUF488 family)